MTTRAYATPAADQPLGPFTIERRAVGPRDVAIDVLYCGICHSDIHQARAEWGKAIFPMVPGHEVIGRVSAIGGAVTKVAVGALVGVGCLVDSCGSCRTCHEDHEQFCEKGAALTYNGTEMDRVTPTYGGYSTRIVVTERFVLKVSETLDPAGAAPLLCAGITTYSPLREFDCGPGMRVGVVGLGGLGHVAVKLAAAMGAEVTMLSTSAAKGADAVRLGASDFALTTDRDVFRRLGGTFDLLVDTVSAPHDYNAYLRLLRPYGTMAIVGAPPKPVELAAFALIGGNKRIAGSNIGGIAETQEMLDFCAEHGVVADVEIIPASEINRAYERVMKSDVRYRFVVDAATL